MRADVRGPRPARSGSPDGDPRTTAQREAVGGAGGRRRELEVIRAAEERADAVGGGLRIRCDEPFDALPAGVDLDRAPLAETLDRLAIDVRHEIPEAIDAQHDADDRVGRHIRHWNIDAMNLADGTSERGEL